jgi:maltooligosyltrehalose trehalohydrolase
MILHIAQPGPREFPLRQDGRGYWRVTVDTAAPLTKYYYAVDGAVLCPDPASAYQPEGVHKPSAIIDHSAFSWTDGDWRGIPLESMIIYELHVGTFTAEGTFAGVAGRLNDLRELGVNTIELMPICQFPGHRNWGYDGVFPFSVQNSYGGPDGLKLLVNACHTAGFAVVLDVVCNHLGPEGNYLGAFAPYFTDRYKTPWGSAVNFDGPYSDEVRAYFIECALMWFEQYHIDALRLDAVHAMYDMSAQPFLAELARHVKTYSESTRRRYLIAESDLNDARLIKAPEAGGHGLDAQWCDDYHHSIHVLLTGESRSYYADFGNIADLRKSMLEGYVYTGNYSVHRKRRHGNSPKGLPASGFVVFSQNHDQVGNRALGERLTMLTGLEQLKLAAATVLLGPYVPMLFMGEEYGERAPFLYFVSFEDPVLAEAVWTGRSKEYQMQGLVPDPQNETTFSESRLTWDRREQGSHALLLTFYRTLITLRKKIPALAKCSKDGFDVFGNPEQRALGFFRNYGLENVFCCFNFSAQQESFDLMLPEGTWEKLIDSATIQWLGPGSRMPDEIRGPTVTITMEPFSAVLYKKE